MFEILAKEMSDSNHYSPKGLTIVADFIIEKLIDNELLSQ